MLRNILFLFLLAAGSLSAREYHVSKIGNDSAPGSVDNPLRSINAAAQKALPGDTITVHTGVYREWVDPRHGGMSETNRILYRAAEGETVEIKGSEVITGWKRVKKEQDIWSASVPNSLFANFNPFNELFVGDWLSKPIPLHLGEVFLNGVSMYECESADSLHRVRTSHRDPKGIKLNWYASVGAEVTTITACFGGLDPNKETVEVTARPTCFYPSREGINYITFRGFKVSQAATRWAAPTAEQVGMVATHWSKGWIIEDNVITNSKSAGITLGKEAGTGDNVWTYNPDLDGANHYLECIFRVLRHGWDKENVGSNIVRNNIVSECGQAGICGSMGCAFSQVYGNEVYSICSKFEFGGAEMAGIKFHGGIDTYIHDNKLHDCPWGLWMDWMAQGARASHNLFYNNWLQDVLFEMDHGPYVVDNNIMLSPSALFDESEGGAYIDNFFAGSIIRRQDKRYVPYMLEHSTQVKGVCTIDQSDNRFVGNMFVCAQDADPLACYEGSVYPVIAKDNVTILPSDVKVGYNDKGVSLKVSLQGNPGGTVEGGSLGTLRLSKYTYQNPDGTPVSIKNNLVEFINSCR